MTDVGSELSPEDELALRIGRVARAHVHLDRALRDVHRTLSAPGLAVFLTNDILSTNALVSDCRKMIAKANLAENVLAGGRAALEAASVANERRNRVVHDMWMRSEDQEGLPRWLGRRLAKGTIGVAAPDPPRDLGFLDVALVEMTRATFRVQGLYWALWEVLPGFRGSREPGERSDLSKWIAVMHDRFDVLDDGWFQPHDDPVGDTPPSREET